MHKPLLLLFAPVFFPLIFGGTFALIGILAFGFWLWMLIEAATREPATSDEKLLWVLIVLFTHIIGALIFFFVRRPQFNQRRV